METGACAPDRRSRREPSRKARRPRGGDCPTRRLQSRFSTGGVWPWVGVITVVCCTTVLAPQQAFAQDFRITVNFLRLGGGKPQAPGFSFEMVDTVSLKALTLPTFKFISADSGTKVTNSPMTVTDGAGLPPRISNTRGARRDAGDAVSPGHASETWERLRRSSSSGIAPEGTVANQIHHSPTPEAHL